MFGIDKRLIGGTTGKRAGAGLGLVIVTMALVTIAGRLVDLGLDGLFPILEYLPWLLAILVLRGNLGWVSRLGQYRASAEARLTVCGKHYAHAKPLGPGILGEKRTGELVAMAVATAHSPQVCA